MRENTAWNTDAEKDWIKTMGDSLLDRDVHFSKKELLKNYIKSCKTRVNWGKIDKKECLKIAREELAALV